MIAWGYEIIEFGEHEAEKLISLDIIACQMAEGGAMGYHGGLFFVSSTGEKFFTCLLEPSAYSGYSMHTPLHVVEQVFPPLKDFESGLLGHGVTCPAGFKYEYLGMGNHLLVKDCIYEKFKEIASANLQEHPETILYNLWMDVVCEILKLAIN